MFSRDGILAEFAVILADAVRPRSNSQSPPEAAVAGSGFVTAWVVSGGDSWVEPRQMVLITGAPGAVGSAAVQIAR